MVEQQAGKTKFYERIHASERRKWEKRNTSVSFSVLRSSSIVYNAQSNIWVLLALLKTNCQSSRQYTAKVSLLAAHSLTYSRNIHRDIHQPNTHHFLGRTTHLLKSSIFDTRYHILSTCRMKSYKSLSTEIRYRAWNCFVDFTDQNVYPKRSAFSFFSCHIFSVQCSVATNFIRNTHLWQQWNAISNKTSIEFITCKKWYGKVLPLYVIRWDRMDVCLLGLYVSVNEYTCNKANSIVGV